MIAKVLINRWHAVILLSLTLLSLTMTMSGCGVLQPKLVQPKVELASLHLGKSRGLSQSLELELLITNNNDQDLSIRSLRYEIGLDDLALFSGENTHLPILKSHEATAVTLELSADLLQVFKLIEHLSHQTDLEKISYQLNADLDFSAWLPTMHVNKKGSIPLKK